MRGILRREAVLGPLAASGAMAGCGSRAVELPGEPPVTQALSATGAFAEAGRAAGRILIAHRAALRAPALSGAVAVAGRVVWAGAVGWADVEARKPATPATRFRIGSTSKALTATITGRLRDRGVVDLDAPISRYMAVQPRWRDLTLRQLHSHTAGLPGYENNRDWLGLLESLRKQRHYVDVRDALEQFDDAPLIYPPGESFHYSSFDVVLASAVQQSVVGVPYLSLLAREVCDPLGLTGVGGDDATRSIPERAQFYQVKPEGVARNRPVDLSGRYASGGLLSTSRDLVRLGAAYMQGGFLSPGTVRELWTPQRLKDGAPNPQSYALGWRSQRRVNKVFGRDLWRVHHGGVSEGAMSFLVVYPDLNLSVAINMNTEAERFDDFAEPADRIARLFHEAATR